ncbi:hypothetical protein [Candidatus Nitrospira bockiana]
MNRMPRSEHFSMEAEILESLRHGPLELQALAGSLGERWSTAFLAVDQLSRSGRVRLEWVGRARYLVSLATGRGAGADEQDRSLRERDKLDVCERIDAYALPVMAVHDRQRSTAE